MRRFSLAAAFTLTTWACLLFALIRWQGGFGGIGLFGQLLVGMIAIARFSKQDVVFGLHVSQITFMELFVLFTISLLVYSFSFPPVLL